ncbi:hypothetical protein Q73A0000_01880 [Kaistella flava (ex Peng et al. 2021)]|uniref:Uncharacterized protein n=1 Tax=Kaistella flava (ex Peng et al. 2021) TaxID=2038776 RepID=A0A7M2Y4U3_9FLAO|nr:DUF6266 family protein [Kaistella flava (ex Peng et al. 2021)]QOW09191.1 hypothetical protein Q73A0000_01880 [Kaistella flava (ex Peng et al. 2021)]
MGTIKKGILGGFSGTVGTVVGATWRGMDVIRSRPKSSGGKPTPLQIMQRAKFALAIKFQNSLRAMQSRLYGENAGVKSRVNLAASYLLREVVAYENDQAILMMEKVIVTKGTLTGFQNLAVTAAADQTLNFTWVDNSAQMLAKATDIFCTAIYEEEAAEFAIMEGPEQRDGGTASVVLPEGWAGKTVYVYAFFQTVEQDAACNSLYLSTVVVQ